jgi:3-oxoadipate enol-lactonase
MTTLPPLHHAIAGLETGAWVTFIPGIGNDSSFWQAQAQALATHGRTLTFDPWGHANSPAPPDPCHFADVLRGVIQLWDDLGIERSSVVGLGFGGSVALALGIEVPDRVDRIVACCCRPKQPDDRREFWRNRREVAATDGIDKLADATVDRWLSQEFRASHVNVDAQLRAMMKRTTVQGYRAYVAAFIEMDFERRLPELSVPTLLVAAEHDHGGGPVEDMRAMAATIPGASMEVISGCGHICTHEAPQRVADLLLEFFGFRSLDC